MEALVRRGKMLADVAQRGRSQHRVGDGVKEDVGVGMTIQPSIMRDFHTAEDEATSSRKAMDVVADAGPHGPHSRLRTVTSPQQGVSYSNVLRTGHFQIRQRGGNNRRWQTGDLIETH